MQKIKKVVIPAAGWGTRFLPTTKAIPKEMLPIVDKPVIQYVVEEAVNSGIKDIVIVTGWQKRSIEDHFDRCLELEDHLKKQGKKKALEEVKRIANLANFIYIRQKGELYGNGLPVLAAAPVLNDEPFAVMWGDEFIQSNPPRLAQMLKAYEKHEGVIISGVRINDRDKISRYGIADIEKVDNNLFRIKKIVEKPSPDEAPSNLATHGAYILPPKIINIIRDLKPSKDGEIWLTDAVNILIESGYPVYACEIEGGKYYDTGNKLEYLKTVIDFALQRPEFSEELKDYIKKLSL